MIPIPRPPVPWPVPWPTTYPWDYVWLVPIAMLFGKQGLEQANGICLAARERGYEHGKKLNQRLSFYSN